MNLRDNTLAAELGEIRNKNDVFDAIIAQRVSMDLSQFIQKRSFDNPASIEKSSIVNLLS